MGQGQRRKFLIAAGGVLAAGYARAQGRATGQVRRIGVLALGSPDPKQSPSEYPTTVALRKLGWVEGQNLAFERRFAEGKPERLAGLAQELVAKRVELIIALGAAAVAAARATQTIPIVFLNVTFPIEQGLVASYARPGGNRTGTATQIPELVAKRVEILREIAPGIKRVYIAAQVEYLETVAGGMAEIGTVAAIAGLGLEVRRHFVRERKDVDAFLAGALAWRADAISFGAGAITGPAIQKIADFALQHRLPSATTAATFAEAGILLAYGVSGVEFDAMFYRGMEYVDRILRGARPADLPVVQPSTFELVINMRTAKALGLTVPRAVQLRADRLVE